VINDTLVEQFPYAIWFIERDIDLLVIGCLHHKRDMKLAVSRANQPAPSSALSNEAFGFSVSTGFMLRG
jgi:hypothetical protein